MVIHCRANGCPKHTDARNNGGILIDWGKSIKSTGFYSENDNMKKIVVTFITIICSWIGWWIGDKFGLMTALVLSMIGTGLGMYYGRRLIEF